MTTSFVTTPTKPKFIDVTTDLRQFALVTYAVAPERLAAQLPSGFEPDVFTLADGTKTAFVSAAIFHDYGFHPAFCNWPTFSFEQTNYRAYVVHEGKKCVWFFGTTLHTPFVIVPRYAWKLPWHYADLKISAEWDGEVCRSYQYTAQGKWGNAHCEMVGTAEACGTLNGFCDDEETAFVLTHPLIGYYRRRDGKVGTYNVWHDRLRMNRAVVKTAQFEVFEKLGLVLSGDKPHSALVQKSTQFIIYLPPRLV